MDSNGLNDVPVLVEDPFELERLREANAQIEQHDVAIETQRDRWFYASVVLFLVSLGLGLGWRLSPITQHVPYVQVVKEDVASGVMTVMAQPTRLQDFVVSGEAIRDMLVRYIDDWRRQGRDYVEALNHVQHVYARTCGVAQEHLKTLAAERDALKPEQRPFSVDLGIASVLPTDSARTWRGQWEERWLDAKGKVMGQHRYVADFTVSRWVPTDIHILSRNGLGVCVSSISLSEVPR